MALEFRDILLRQDDFTLTADLTVPAGRHAVIGASGSGKSTLLALVAGFLAPTQGRLLWEGQDITAMPPGKRPVSILFQHNNLFPHLSVKQNIGMGLRPDLRLNRAQQARVAQVLDQVGLSCLGARRPDALSGGQQSRVALARVLLRARPLLLLDEPFAALGPALKAEMLALLAQIAADTTVLMVTHDPADARAFAPDTLLVEGGRVHPPRPTGPLLDDPPPGLRAYLG
ncbi:ATP-binding cassette domain-containing protein [Paracoccus hibiscisoli]|uniref:ATP-binding cassette domain-containing protein n=1 Tax=Paracoccus hibiscisoli TaxID=2023261 RepID=A0A4U0QT26_9RHOB|nr:ATP-binding cassette domain-containing protein [Paracoccus hibiscisoli]TJZ85155.1 ATP-binding cassette domain-containing protein [Paracoccus hibiscisoli]